MERTTIESSVIRSAGYNPETRVLEVEFNSGAIYQYEAVPAEVFAELVSAESAGRFFESSIRDAGYAYRRIE